MKDILIIGAGPIGIYAWNCAGMLGLKGYIIEGNGILGGQPQKLYPEKLLYDIPGFSEIKTKKFIKNLINQAIKNTGKMTYIKKSVFKVITKITNGFMITLTTNKILKVKTILITSGNGIFVPIKLKHIDEYKEYYNLLYFVKNPFLLKNKKIIILGGGDSAVDWANYFVENNISKNIIIIHRRKLYRAKEGNVQKLKKNNIIELKPYNIKTILTLDNKIIMLTLINTITNKIFEISGDYFIVQYGAKIIPFMLEQFMLKTTSMSKIIIKSNGQTNNPYIFAAGNSAHYKGKYYNMVTGFGEAINAVYNIKQIVNKKI